MSSAKGSGFVGCVAWVLRVCGGTGFEAFGKKSRGWEFRGAESWVFLGMVGGLWLTCNRRDLPGGLGFRV